MKKLLHKMLPHKMLPHRGKDQVEKKDPDALPVLDPRVRSLTPAPSNQELRQAYIDATSESPLFQKLPSEIRTRILIEAFGGRTVHMDLSQDQPDVEIPKNDKSSDGAHVHGRKRVYTAGRPGHNYLMRDSQESKEWIWRGSVCHRNPPKPYDKEWTELEPAEDFCRHGGIGETDVGDICEQWHEKDGEASCDIGAMGWLLSCRQAYKEGIEVLYSTNTIHSASKLMLLNLDKLLLPQRLSTIKSLELVWTFDPYLGDCEPVKEPCRDSSSFDKMLEAIPVFFPALQHLHFAIQGEIYPGERTTTGGWGFMKDHVKAMKVFEKDILLPFDAMGRRLGLNARELTLACSSFLYGRARETAIENKQENIQQIHLGDEKERYWRPLPGGRAPGNSLDGYWVQLGQRDVKPIHLHIIGCFGFPSTRPMTPPEKKVLACPASLYHADMRR
ncbi:unnamed protein product [Clonostachys rosea]|uniref:DUF7730 domain-containing protein n=1 Tax=Bionectria ochroleuca TaxID=29856 RepID=A0ABY6UZQ3_BIOOC|nr:unnamed protein product [Clonostachys rosea]